jgi:TolB-like protein/DNA-binding winged helix-turn-helix (wHTH) protein
VPNGVIRFADFELDNARYELRRGDRVLKLEKIPMEILGLLVERDGQLVARDEIVEKIWGKDVFLDTEHGINTAIRKIRQALGDDPDNPRFVQTVTGKGYRFIAITSTVPAKGNGNADTLPASIDDRRAVTQLSDEASDIRMLAPVAPATELKPRVGRAARFAGLALIALSGIAALVFGLNVRGVRNRFFPPSPATRIHSLAVLPLENLSSDPAQEYFADGMTDELITMLAKNPELRVVSRTSVMQYKKVHRPLADVARELGVDGILEGSVERSGNRVHINVQLIYAPQDRHLWAESYDRDLNDLVPLQTELAQTIARQVGLTATPGRPSQRTINAQAYDAYLLGRYYWFGGEHLVASRKYFLKAIELQPDYAAAHAALADCYLVEVVEGAPRAELQEAMIKGEEEARKAIALDDSAPQAHHSMAAFNFFFAWNLKEAERESARSIELNPRDSEAHHLRAYILSALQRNNEAVEEDRKSMAIDPRVHPWALGFALLRAGQYDAGIAELLARVVVQPEDVITHEMLSDLYWQKGMFAESVHELARTYVPKSGAALEAAFQHGGAKGAMEWRLAHWKKLQAKDYIPPLAFAGTTARLGRKQETLHYLEQAYAEHVPWLVFIQSDPDFDGLHSDPRYQAIVKKIGLPPAS